MSMLLLYGAAIGLGLLIAFIINVVARRRVVNPGVVAGALVLVAAGLSAVLALKAISARSGISPSAEGEVFGELVIGPALLALVICFFIYRRSTRSAGT
jgi:ABC-type uncharacterized transport system permease subunit